MHRQDAASCATSLRYNHCVASKKAAPAKKQTRSAASKKSTTAPVEEMQLEILGYRDLVIGQKVTIANLEWRLEECQRKLRVVTRHRDEMKRSATWRIGRLVVTLLWPVRKIRSILRPAKPSPSN